MRKGDPLQVDGVFHGLKQEVPLFGVKLKIALARVTPAASLEGKSGLKERHESWDETGLRPGAPDFTATVSGHMI